MVTIDAEFERYADLLQVPYDVTSDDLKKAYESRMECLHPDNGDTAATVKETSDAYRTLMEHLKSKQLSPVEAASIAVENASPSAEKQASVGGHSQQEVHAFRCQHCGKAFTRKSNMERHMRCHTGEKPFVCSVCQKAFRQSHDLAAHCRVHTGEKPYTCGECNKSFAGKQKLRLHEAAYHSGQRRYECDDCPAAFVQMSQLKMHSKVRSSGAPILDCAKCGRCFSREGALQAHSKKCEVVWF